MNGARPVLQPASQPRLLPCLQAVAEREELLFMETSALDGSNVEQAFVKEIETVRCAAYTCAGNDVRGPHARLRACLQRVC